MKFHTTLLPTFILLLFIGCANDASQHNTKELTQIHIQQNVHEFTMTLCSQNPLTGYYRDGYCNSYSDDLGVHSMCVKLSHEFLLFSKENGNDLIAPHEERGFPGLKPGDLWCVCADWWKLADDKNIAPDVILEATNLKTLRYVKRERLVKYGLEGVYY